MYTKARREGGGGPCKLSQVGAARAGTLLFLYGLGHCLLLIAVGTSVGLAGTLINSTRLTNAARRLRQGAGVLVLVAAAWLVLR